MKTNEMIAYCNELTANGRKLAVTWQGGNDSGWFEFQIDNQPTESPGPIEQQIINIVERIVGYGSFAGNFDASGEVVYNPKSYCFEGQDECSEDEYETWDCKLPVAILQTIWFDKMLINFESDQQFEGSVRIKLQVNNGPLSPAHEHWEKSYSELLEKQFIQEIHQIDNFSGVWFDLELEAKDFKVQGKRRFCYINSFDYAKFETNYTKINVSLL